MSDGGSTDDGWSAAGAGVASVAGAGAVAGSTADSLTASVAGRGAILADRGRLLVALMTRGGKGRRGATLALWTSRIDVALGAIFESFDDAETAPSISIRRSAPNHIARFQTSCPASGLGLKIMRDIWRFSLMLHLLAAA